MQVCAAGGTIVIVNVTKFQSDAILVSPTAINTISLPLLLAGEAEAWLSKKWTGRVSEFAQKNKEYLNSSMPFYAAGTYSPSSTENIISRAISSYTPSIKALGYAQHRARATVNIRGSLLIATMPTTPKAPHLDARKVPATMRNTTGQAVYLGDPLPDLRGVVDEKREVMEITSGRMPVEALDFPSVDQVVNSLRGCSIAHFACYGSTNHTDPSSSGLVLQKRGEG
ncbi:hypothetical protein VE04_07853 [Pseudogymnoascus sp. 24MN13]|nr:hypothetical protein VE04_07853 [Pseudogymnoascus sp. 24MN13]